MRTVTIILTLLAVLALGSVVHAQDSSKTPALKDLWRLSDSLTRTSSQGQDNPEAATYIYVQDFEVRHEILMPFYVLEDWVTLNYDNPDAIDTLEQLAMRQPIEELFTSRNPVNIDGLTVRPLLTQLDFIAPKYLDSLRDVPRVPVDAVTAWVGVILTYSTKGTPNTVELTWDMFNEHMTAVKSIVYEYENTGEFRFSVDSATYCWHNPGRPSIPPITEVPHHRKSWWHFGSDISDGDAEAIFGTLLKNVYRAFDYRTESDVYDALALSVGGELLSEVYLQVHRSLKMAEQGGAVSRIKDVSILDGQKQEPNERFADANQSFGYKANWTVEGTVEHWGHIHARTNGYEAQFSIVVENNAWKIVDLQVLHQERVKFESTVRE